MADQLEKVLGKSQNGPIANRVVVARSAGESSPVWGRAMPNLQGAKKRLRQSIDRCAANRSRKSALRTLLKKFRGALQSGNVAVAETEYRVFQRKVDQAVAKGVIHRNKAARLKSRCQHSILSVKRPEIPRASRRGKSRMNPQKGASLPPSEDQRCSGGQPGVSSNRATEGDLVFSLRWRSRMERVVMSHNNGPRGGREVASQMPSPGVVFSAWPSDQLLIVEVASIREDYAELTERARSVAARLKIGETRTYSLYPKVHQAEPAQAGPAPTASSLDESTDSVIEKYFERKSGELEDLRRAEHRPDAVVIVETDVGDFRFGRSRVNDSKVLNAVLWLTAQTARHAEEIAATFVPAAQVDEFRRRCREAAIELMNEVDKVVDYRGR